MTSTITPGETLHWKKSGLDYLVSDIGLSGVSATSRRAQTFTLTDQILESNRGRDGFSLFEIAGDPEAQIARYGFEILGVGEAPADLLPWEGVELDLARDEAKRQARLLADPADQQRALAAIGEKFGPAPSGQTSSYSPSDEERRRILVGEGRA